MSLDPRLANETLLVLAALRLKSRPPGPPMQTWVLQIVYEAVGDEPPLLGERYVLYLPQKAPSAEAWYSATARFREPPRPAPDEEVA
jgi:hypothetical protein